MMVKKEKKKESRLDQLKEEYASLGEFMDAIPDQLMIFKKNIEIYDRKTEQTHDKLILVYELSDDGRNSHFGERTLAYMRHKPTGKILKVDQDRLRKELGEILLERFDKKPFIDDMVVTLTPSELLEAYDRAVVKKGKVKQIEGCSKFLIYGQKGGPMQLMLRS